MADPVRPHTWPAAQPPAPSPSGRANDARAAAQKAFFDAALAGRSPTATTVTAASQPEAGPRASPAQAVRTVAEAEARATDRLPPPGSIVNILV